MTFLGVLAALALLPATAWGTTTVSYSSSTGLLIQGDSAGEGVEARLPSASRFEVRSLATPAATLVAGSGCQRAANIITCFISGNRVATANLDAGADVFRWATEASADLFVNGGDGNDRLSSGRGLDFLDGGPGDDELFSGDEIESTPVNDVLEGGVGNDVFQGDGGGTDTMRGEEGNDTFQAPGPIVSGPHADLFDGGPGVDVADYSRRGSTVLLSDTNSPGPNNDGTPGEGDDLDKIETLLGGSGNDVLFYTLLGMSVGTVTLKGNRGADMLRVVGRVKTSIDGGLGSDTVFGGELEDRIFSREGEFDAIVCGPGPDFLTADLRDVPLSATCENVDQGDRREDSNVVVRAASVVVGGNGVLVVRLACPRSVRIGCKGALAARLDRSGTPFGAAKRYSIRRGRSALVQVRLRAGQIGAARRRGARVSLRSVERGVHGAKTTLRSLPSRRGYVPP